MDAIFADKVCLFDEHLSETTDLINSKVQNQLLDFEKVIERKFNHLEANLTAKTHGIIDSRCKFLIDEYLAEKEVNIEPLLSCELLRKFEAETTSITNAFLIKHDELQKELNDFKSTVVFLSSSDVIADKLSQRPIDLKDIGNKLDVLTKWVSSMQVDIKSNHRTLDSLEIKSRETNLIIDGLVELPDEVTIQHVSSFLGKSISSFDIDMIDNAYRLGHSRSNPSKSPRRILLHTTSTFIRSLILEYAEGIAKAGLSGARVYITEDLPESIKRKRQDIFKYVAFLKEKGIDATQKGECVIFNGMLYKYEEILNMAMVSASGIVELNVPMGSFPSRVVSPHSPICLLPLSNAMA